MALNWPTYETKEPNNATDPVGNAVKAMTDRAVAQSAANQRQLQASTRRRSEATAARVTGCRSVRDTNLRREHP